MSSLKAHFLLDPDIVFLNHGSFGACPRPVFDTYQTWQRELERQPVAFLGRQATALMAHARLGDDGDADLLGGVTENLSAGGALLRLAAPIEAAARMSMTVRADMLNGFKVCHGGLIATLADSAFAFACNSYNELTMAAGFAADIVAPAQQGDVLTADAVEVMRRGRTGVYDVRVTNQRDELVAVFRGRSYCIKGKQVVPL